MIHDGVGIALLVIVAAQTLIERRDKGFVFLGHRSLLSRELRFLKVSLYK